MPARQPFRTADMVRPVVPPRIRIFDIWNLHVTLLALKAYQDSII
jgi:hypothetical protein